MFELPNNTTPQVRQGVVYILLSKYDNDVNLLCASPDHQAVRRELVLRARDFANEGYADFDPAFNRKLLTSLEGFDGDSWDDGDVEDPYLLTIEAVPVLQ